MGERWPGGRKVLAVCKGRITQMLDSQRLDTSPMHCEKDLHCPYPETIQSQNRIKATSISFLTCLTKALKRHTPFELLKSMDIWEIC